MEQYFQFTTLTFMQTSISLSYFSFNNQTINRNLFVSNLNFLFKTAEKDEYEYQQKELEKVANPIITSMYQGRGGPGGFSGPGSQGGHPPSSGGGGPTIEEVD